MISKPRCTENVFWTQSHILSARVDWSLLLCPGLGHRHLLFTRGTVESLLKPAVVVITFIVLSLAASKAMYRSSSILLVCLVALVGSAHAKLRGNIDIVNDLQARATNPTLRADIRGKSVRELLGDNYHDLPQEKDRRVDAPPTQQKGRRRTHGRKKKQSLQQQRRELSNVQDIPQQKGSTGRSLQQTDSMTRAIQFFTVSEHSAVIAFWL